MAEVKKKRSEASTSGGGGGGKSVVIDVGRRKSTCGYCKSGARTSISHGLLVNSLTVDHYQALLDRGWRRSGCFLYKPEMEKTCCPSYTIRLKTSDFSPSKEQARVLKRMERFLDGTLEMKKMDKVKEKPNACGGSCSDAYNCTSGSAAVGQSVVNCDGKDKADQFMNSLSEKINQLVRLCQRSGELPPDILLPKASVKKVAPTKRKLQAEEFEVLICSSNIAFQIAATLCRTRTNIEHGVRRNSDSCEHSPKKIAETLVSQSKQISEPIGLSIKACNGHINFYSATQQSQIVAETGDRTISKPARLEESGKFSKSKCKGILGQRRRFEIRLKKSSFDSEEYSLYRKYQLQVHNDTPDHVTESSYRRFLVDSPLIYISPSEGTAVPPCGFGSFHQQYVVDGKLIAVGVIDILPKCLSSKYLFWDPDLAFLSLGKYSALKEIQWVNENQIYCPSLQYYYLGYYIHSCSKMRYKAAYQPSELLCPLRYEWVPYDAAKSLLDKRKYVVLSDLNDLQKEDLSSLNVIDTDMEDQQNEYIQEATNDVRVDNDEMEELEYEDSDDESDSEASGSTIMDIGDADLGNVLIGLNETSLRYKELRHAFDLSQRILFESQLQRYTRVVGTELSEEMVYSLG